MCNRSIIAPKWITAQNLLKEFVAQEVSITVLSYVSNRVDIVLCSWCPSSSLSPKSLHPSALASSLQPVTFVRGTFIMWTQGVLLAHILGDPLGTHTQGDTLGSHTQGDPLGSHTQGVPLAHILRGYPWPTYSGGTLGPHTQGVPLAHILRGYPWHTCVAAVVRDNGTAGFNQCLHTQNP
jgi:hypothetical protein